MFVAGAESHIVSASIGQSRRATFKLLRDALTDDSDYAINDSVNVCAVTHKATGTRVSVMAANGKTAMGLVRTPWVLIDEPGAHEINGGSLTWDAIRYAMGKPGSPLRAIIAGTLAPLATSPGHWFFDLVNAGSVRRVHVVALRGGPSRRLCEVGPDAGDRAVQPRHVGARGVAGRVARGTGQGAGGRRRTGIVPFLQIEPADRRRILNPAPGRRLEDRLRAGGSRSVRPAGHRR